MPLYEYHCKACDASFEALVPFSRADEVTCEVCGSPNVERLASTFASSVEGTPAGPCGSSACAPSG